jgi:hypothetical protein
MMQALHGPLRNYNSWGIEKGAVKMKVSCLWLHFKDGSCIQVCAESDLRFFHETPAYMPETDGCQLAQLVVGAAVDAQFKVEDDSGFVLGLYELVQITCATPIFGVRLRLWSCPAGTLATRGFEVSACLQRTPLFCASNLDSFVQSELGNVVKFQLPLPSNLSVTFVNDKWKLSLYQDLTE